MKVRDLNGREHSWNLSGHVPPKNDTYRRSQYHLRARALLLEMFPLDQILEEVPLPGTRLTADFYLPLRKMLIEVHGEQHYKYIPHFHGNRAGFIRSKKNDANKEEWCQINNIEYIALKHTDSDEEWEQNVRQS
jgi:hypothetical protein